jgi:P-type conjugative transfer ATPase TrbB
LQAELQIAKTISVFPEETNRRIEKILRELGPVIGSLLVEPMVVEILLNADGTLWVERLGQKMETLGTFSASKAEALISSLAAYHGTTVTKEKAILECVLPPYGARFEAILPPVVSSPVFSIRLRASALFSLTKYVSDGIMTEAEQQTIEQAVLERKNILVVGGTGTGKTTLTNAIIAEIVKATPEHRLVIIEDTAEIQCAAENAVLLNSTDTVDMLQLLKATMRLRPDRILVGEVRGPEALALLKAWNTGHPGGVATVHANNAPAGLIRMEQLIAEATPAPMHSLIAEAVDLIVSIVKTPEGRKVNEIVSVTGHNSQGYVFQNVA